MNTGTDAQTKRYRQAQFKKLKNRGVYSSNIQIWDGEGNKTHTLSITQKEYAKIKEILTK